ncbi:unnamed protein product [Rhizophagus irregularis]|nr:unnamed protein product [Rhizophagus irregularis]
MADTMVFSSLDASFDSLLFSLLGCLRRILIDDQTTIGHVDLAAGWVFSSLDADFNGLHKNLAARLRIYCKNTIRASTSDLEKREFLAARLRIYCKNTIRASTSDLEKREFLTIPLNILKRVPALLVQDKTVATLIFNPDSLDFGCINFDQSLEYLDVKNLVM